MPCNRLHCKWFFDEGAAVLPLGSLRGGFGAFFDSIQPGIYNNRFVDVTPFSVQVNVTSPQGPFSNPYLGITNPFPRARNPA
jgi:hypothetical protein